MVDEEGFVNTDVNDKEQLTSDGAYVFIDASDERISIYQDFIGAYGLYLFQEGDYFAISNSFIKLVDHIKSNHEISLNLDYANDFLFSSLTTHSYGGTLVDEISFLPRNIIVNIDKTNNDLEFKEINYNEHSIGLNSKEGIETTDEEFSPKEGFLPKSLDSKFPSKQTIMPLFSKNEVYGYMLLSFGQYERIFYQTIYEIFSNM